MNFKLLVSIIVLFVALSVTAMPNTIAKEKTETAKKDTYTVAVIETDKGTMKAVLYTDLVPITTQNFIKLANNNFYKNMIWHRVVKDFVIQTGDPEGTGSGGSGKTIPLEINKKLKHKKGAVAMARKADPDSATSQFYITLSPQEDLDGHYAVFGQLYEGMENISKIKQGDKLISVQIIEVPKKEVKF